jgi:hypothetical protein
MLATAAMLTACMGNPEDIGGFDGRMPKPPTPCSSNDPNAANNPACTAPPPAAVVPGFSISSGSHYASSSTGMHLKIMGRTAGSFVTPGKITSANYVVRVGTNRQTFDADGN